MYSIKINGTLNGYFAGVRPRVALFIYSCNVLSAILNSPPMDFVYHWKFKYLKITYLSFADDIYSFLMGT